MPQPTARLLVLLLASHLGLCGCRPSFDGRVYHGEGFAFRITTPPEGWRQVQASDAAITFRNDAHRGAIMVNGRCGLDGDDVPLIALTNHLFLEFTDRDIESQHVVPFDGREAMHTVLDAKLDGVAMRYDVWVLKKDGCVYDLLYFAPPGDFASGRDDFLALVRGFATVSDDGR